MLQKNYKRCDYVAAWLPFLLFHQWATVLSHVDGYVWIPKYPTKVEQVHTGGRKSTSGLYKC